MISVLFTQKKSIYNELNVDTWDKERNALKYTGKNVIIAHPPCRTWGNLSHWAKAEPGEKELAIWAIWKIRENGGILEHPKTSKLWKEMKLPQPGEKDQHGGWTLNIDQHWYGHRAKKNTNLYIVGIEPKMIPPIPINLNAITHTVNSRKRTRQEISKKEREATPIKLAKWLITTARMIEMKILNGQVKLNT